MKEDTYELVYTEKEVAEWVRNDVHKPKIRFKDLEHLGDYVSTIPPVKLFKRINRLILDEGVNPAMVEVFITNEQKETVRLDLGLEHRFGLVYKDPNIE